MLERSRWPRVRRHLFVFLSALLLVPWFATKAFAIDPIKDFERNCKSCHTIGGGRLVGPDLKDVLARAQAEGRGREWLVKFIVDPASMLDGGDPHATRLMEEARNVRMANIAGMTKERAESLLDLISAESKLEKSRFRGIQLSDRPFTPEDLALGEQLFTGEVRLAHGGPSCLSCHTIGGMGVLGGGRLGPDLTKVFERYQNRRNLGTWLTAPATETMRPIFRDRPIAEEEILPLLAYFENATKTKEEDAAPRGLVFLLLGLGGAVGAVLLLNRLWHNRFRAVRRPLVDSATIPAPGQASREPS